MEVKGKVVKILPLQTGEGKNGTWKKQEFIIEVPGQYPKKVCFCLWGDNIQQNPLNPGRNLTVSFDLESREYNNRWYTEAKAWKIVKAESGSSNIPEQETNAPYDQSEDGRIISKDAPDMSTDDLPF